MEIASTAISVIGLASLFSTCIETLDTLSSAARYGINREILQTRIEVERLRLTVWGESVGLAEINPESKESEITENDLTILDESIRSNTLRPAVAGLLTCFAHYFEDIEELQKRYGLTPRHEGRSKSPARGKTPTREALLSKFQKTYQRFQERASEAQKNTSPLKKAVWAVTDERKFRSLLAEIKAINDSLVSLLPAIGEKVRVRMRSEIMKNKDVGQLQNIVNAADDITGLITETASLRLEILSTPNQRQTRYQAPDLLRAKTLTPKATPAIAPTPPPAPEPKSVVESLITASLDATPSSISAPSRSLDDSYGDIGALVIHIAYYKQERFRCFSWAVGSDEGPETRSQVQPVFHPIFEFQFFPEAVLSIADDLLEADVSGDKKYAGWSPGSTSLTGFAREISLWQMTHIIRKKDELRWSRTKTKPLLSQFVDQRWREIVKDGLGEDFTDKKGYERLRELIGPPEHTWLDPDENIKLRHQITDLLGAITSSILPNLEEVGSMSLVAYREKLDPDSKYSFLDFMHQLLLAREANLRIQRAKRRWYGGITNRAIYDMVAADLFARHMEPNDSPEQGYTPSPGVVKQQLDGIIKFADEMQWPYADEIRQAAIKLQNTNVGEMNIDLRVSDWICGWVLPGGTFSMILVAVLYSLSSTLRGHLPTGAIQIKLGCFGIVFPNASYWGVRSVLGKVLAPLALDSESGHSQVRCLGGWVGPCPSVSLPDCAFGRLVMLSGHAPPSVDSQDKETARHKNVRGDGAAWTLPTPPELSTNTAVLQTVRLSKAPPSPETMARDAESFSARLDFRLTRSRTFATLTLYTNSVFIAAPPCQGTHRVDPHASEKYTFAVRGVEELAQISRKGGSSAKIAILVVNATGGPTSEVFARAWCCHTGTNAVIWKREGGTCCFKCALVVASTDGLAMGVLIAT